MALSHHQFAELRGSIRQHLERSLDPPARGDPIEDDTEEHDQQYDHDDDRQAVDPLDAGLDLTALCATELEGLDHDILPHPRRISDSALSGAAPDVVTV